MVEALTAFIEANPGLIAELGIWALCWGFIGIISENLLSRMFFPHNPPVGLLVIFSIVMGPVGWYMLLARGAAELAMRMPGSRDAAKEVEKKYEE